MSPQYYMPRFSLKAFLVLEKKIFMCFFFFFFLSYIGMVAILINGAEPFEQIDDTPLTEGTMWNLVKIGQAVSEKMTFKVFAILYIYIA